MKKINDFTTTVFISIILLAIIGMLSFALNYEMNRFKDELQIAYDGLQTTQEALYVAENELSTTKEVLQIEFQKEDRLSAELKKLNVVETHEEAVNFGVSSKGVWVLIKKNS